MVKKDEARGGQPLGLQRNDDDEGEFNIPAESNSQDENFDWVTDPAVILHDQAAVAAYFNKFGELVVKQRDTLGCEATLFIAPENVKRFLEGLGERAAPAPKKFRVVSGGDA